MLIIKIRRLIGSLFSSPLVHLPVHSLTGHSTDPPPLDKVTGGYGWTPQAQHIDMCGGVSLHGILATYHGRPWTVSVCKIITYFMARL